MKIRALSLVACLFAVFQSAGAATVNLYVDTDSGNNTNNGSSWVLAFKNAYNAVIAIPTPISSPYVVHCRGTTADTNAYGVSGRGSTSVNTITIQTDLADRHSGVWDDSKYHMVFDNKTGVGANDDFVNFYGIQFNSIYGATGGHTMDMHPSASGVQKVAYCIFKATITGNPTDFVAVHSGDYGTLYAWNNIVCGYKNGSQSLLIAFTGYRKTYLYNNTIYNCGTGVYLPSSVTNIVAVNNLFVSVNQVSMGGYGAFAAGTDYNATDNAGLCVTGGQGNGLAFCVNGSGDTHEQVSVSTTGLFTDAVNGNFSLTATSSAQVKGTAATDPGSGLFSDDITGSTRTGAWDIGAFEYVGVIGATTNTIGTATLGTSSL